MAKQKIKFTRSTSKQEGDVVYKPGDELECEQASADRWIRRKAAELAKEPVKKITPKKKDS